MLFWTPDITQTTKSSTETDTKLTELKSIKITDVKLNKNGKFSEND